MNTVISKWLGEPRECGPSEHPDICLCGALRPKGGCIYDTAPDYENDESAWTQELYRKIEETGIRDKFVDQFIFITGETEDRLMSDFLFMWLSLKATPAQKAAALSRAIEETE